MNFPYTHVAGDTLDFAVSVPDYPPSAGWTLKYRLTPRFSTPSQTPIDITASANPDGTYQLQQSPATTATWKAGAYGWSRWVEKVGARQTLTSSADQGEVQIRPDPSQSTQGQDSRSHARRMLEQIETALEALNVGAKSYQIGLRSYTSRDLPELTQLRAQYRNEVRLEDAVQDKPMPRLAVRL